MGFTPRQEALRGNSTIQVDIAALTGSAAFAELEYWNAGAAPGDAGTGTTWGDGNLNYRIAMDGNYFRSNGGDSGYVAGRFISGNLTPEVIGRFDAAGHQAAVGILEHPDLTGAFGAVRK